MDVFARPHFVVVDSSSQHMMAGSYLSMVVIPPRPRARCIEITNVIPVASSSCHFEGPHRTILYSSKEEEFTSFVRTSVKQSTIIGRREFRDVGVSFNPRPIQQADMGVQAYSVDQVSRSPSNTYKILYQLGQIAEAQVSVRPSGNVVACQTDLSETESPQGEAESTKVFDESSSYTITSEFSEKIRRTGYFNGTGSTLITTQMDLLEEYPKVHSIRCRVRQRTVQYELLEARRAIITEWPNVIKEVASPITGLFAPVGTAVRAGWLDLTDRNLYIDPTTGLAIPLEEALDKGFIRLSTDQSVYRMDEEIDRPMLLLIERITFGWCPARIVGFTDTSSNDSYSIDEALRLGYIDISTGDPMILDSEAGFWISTEEAAGRNVIQLEPIDPTEEQSEVIEETFSCRVFRITYVRPGGEPSDWLEPLEAARIGLFNWQTGEVASEWRVRPVLPTIGPHMQYLSNRFMPTKWCSLLTARKAGWLRLQAELHPTQWIAYIPTPDSNLGHVVLATHVHLVAPTTIPISAELYGPRMRREEILTPHRPLPPHIVYTDKRRRKQQAEQKVTRHRAQSEAHVDGQRSSHSPIRYDSSETFGRQEMHRRMYLSQQTLMETHYSEMTLKDFSDDSDL
jgi:hypothetical protein